MHLIAQAEYTGSIWLEKISVLMMKSHMVYPIGWQDYISMSAFIKDLTGTQQTIVQTCSYKVISNKARYIQLFMNESCLAIPILSMENEPVSRQESSVSSCHMCQPVLPQHFASATGHKE